MNKKYKSLLSNTAILGIGTFGSKILVFFMVRFYTACLTTEQYGIADIITQTANLLIPLLSAGITEAVFRFALDKGADGKKVFSTGFFTILTGGAVFAALTPALDRISFIRGYGWLVVLYTFCSCMHTLCVQYIRAKGKMKEFAFWGIISTAITIGLNILFLIGFRWNITGYVLSVVLSDAITTVLVFITEKLGRDLSPKALTKKQTAAMLRYSIPMIPTTIFWWITNVADRYMVKYMISDAADGLYALAYKIPTLLILLSGIFIEAWQFSAVTEAEARSGEHLEFFGKVFDSFQALMFISGCGLTAFAKIATRIMAAPSYYEAWQYIPVLASATIFSSLVTFMGSVYLVGKKSMLSFVTSMTGAVLNIALNLWLIPMIGVNGAAIATFFSYFVVFIIRAVNSRRYIPFDLHPVKLTVNTLIAAVQTYCMVMETPFWIPVQIVALGLIFGINARPIIKGILQVLTRRGRRAK
ncbi:MAG: polysaccharide biosynthesis C-terminal domain-containing protein [Clostridia bacterium]|nr:polysaccharide biosynthesis C-terminal domain-containing protein [Clostridia bacterium]